MTKTHEVKIYAHETDRQIIKAHAAIWNCSMPKALSYLMKLALGSEEYKKAKDEISH